MVLNVIVNQREIVEQFDGGRGWDGGMPVSAHGFADEEKEKRASVLARIRVQGSEILVCPADMIVHHAVEGLQSFLWECKDRSHFFFQLGAVLASQWCGITHVEVPFRTEVQQIFFSEERYGGRPHP
jgi:hypothetical protein